MKTGKEANSLLDDRSWLSDDIIEVSITNYNLMPVWTDTNYEPSSNSILSVTHHGEAQRVTLSCPGYTADMDGHGFSVRFSTAHLPALEKLVDELKRVKEMEQQAQVILDRQANEDEPIDWSSLTQWMDDRRALFNRLSNNHGIDLGV